MSDHSSAFHCRFSLATEAGVMQLNMPDVRFSHVCHVLLQRRVFVRVGLQSVLLGKNKLLASRTCSELMLIYIL